MKWPVKSALLILSCFCIATFVACGFDEDSSSPPPPPESATKYAGMYFAYPNEVALMNILIETDTGVDDDFDHRRIYFEYPPPPSCNEPNWKYTYDDYNFWHNQYGIPMKRNRRLWIIHASNLTPGCFYDVRFSYRDTWAGEWNETWGHFSAAPHTSGSDPSKLPSEMGFYAFGDTRTTGDTSALAAVAKAIMDHNSKKTFILHTGDIVYDGGAPVGWYLYNDTGKYKPVLDPVHDLHDNDRWQDFFTQGSVWELLRHIPLFPTLGNHDFQVTAYQGDYYDYFWGDYLGQVPSNTYNYRHYFRDSAQGGDLKDHYYLLAYGSALIWSLTSYPMDTDEYCSKTNANFRPKAEGGTGQYDWLKESLEQHKDDLRWKIVMLHTPLYSPDSCNQSEQNPDGSYKYDAMKLKPLFEDYGVNLVLTGHEHYYARKTVNGIPYLILGGGGAGLSLPADSPCQSNPQCNGFDYVANKHHFAHFQITGEVMAVAIHDSDGKTFDQFTVDKTP